MKIDWESLSYALISSIIVTWILGLILSITGIVQIYPRDIDLLIELSHKSNSNLKIIKRLEEMFPSFKYAEGNL